MYNANGEYMSKPLLKKTYFIENFYSDRNVEPIDPTEIRIELNLQVPFNLYTKYMNPLFWSKYKNGLWPDDDPSNSDPNYTIDYGKRMIDKLVSKIINEKDIMKGIANTGGNRKFLPDSDLGTYNTYNAILEMTAIGKPDPITYLYPFIIPYLSIDFLNKAVLRSDTIIPDFTADQVQMMSLEQKLSLGSSFIREQHSHNFYSVFFRMLPINSTEDFDYYFFMFNFNISESFYMFNKESFKYMSERFMDLKYKDFHTKYHIPYLLNSNIKYIYNKHKFNGWSDKQLNALTRDQLVYLNKDTNITEYKSNAYNTSLDIRFVIEKIINLNGLNYSMNSNPVDSYYSQIADFNIFSAENLQTLTADQFRSIPIEVKLKTGETVKPLSKLTSDKIYTLCNYNLLSNIQINGLNKDEFKIFTEKYRESYYYLCTTTELTWNYCNTLIPRIPTEEEITADNQRIELDKLEADIKAALIAKKDAENKLAEEKILQDKRKKQEQINEENRLKQLKIDEDKRIADLKLAQDQLNEYNALMNSTQNYDYY